MKVTVKNGIFDRVYLESGATYMIDDWEGQIPDDGWTWETEMDAEFNGNLKAGSIDETEAFSAVKIKRRKKGEFKWQTLFIQDVETPADLLFEWWDYLAAGSTAYEYMAVPVIGTTEQGGQEIEVRSEFRDYYMIEPGPETTTTGLGLIFHRIIINTDSSLTYNQETQTQTAFGSKYPYVIKNGNVGYYTGSFNGVWVELKNCEWDWDGAVEYRYEVDRFLTDGIPKVFKDWQGHIFMVTITDTIPQDSGNYYRFPNHQVSWAETGNVKAIADLFDNGFINTEIDRE